MSYWIVVCRPRGTEDWRPWGEVAVWEGTREAACQRIHDLHSARRKVNSTGGRLTDLEFAPAQVRVEAE